MWPGLSWHTPSLSPYPRHARIAWQRHRAVYPLQSDTARVTEVHHGWSGAQWRRPCGAVGIMIWATCRSYVCPTAPWGVWLRPPVCWRGATEASALTARYSQNKLGDDLGAVMTNLYSAQRLENAWLHGKLFFSPVWQDTPNGHNAYPKPT